MQFYTPVELRKIILIPLYSDPGHFIFIEEWPDHTALDAHCASEHFTRLVPLIDQYARKAAQYILMDSLVDPER